MSFVALLLSWLRPDAPAGVLGWPIPLAIFLFFGVAGVAKIVGVLERIAIRA